MRDEGELYASLDAFSVRKVELASDGSEVQANIGRNPNDVIKARKLSTPAELFDRYATFIPSSKFSKLHLHS
jgi:hypothetical protein